jgi:uncharacterized protein (TIGR02757 family)
MFFWDIGWNSSAFALRAENKIGQGILKKNNKNLTTHLEKLYVEYNRREYVHPDPLEFLYVYKSVEDREVVGLVAATLAYGRVLQILRSVSTVLNRLGPTPADFLKRTSSAYLRRRFSFFKHRFTTGEDIAALLIGIKRTRERYGSLNQCFLRGYNKEDETVIPALTYFVSEIYKHGRFARKNGLLASPSFGSACKRMNLYLRWMIRSDAVDPGGWMGVNANRLIVPLDTHMHRIGRMMGLTRRKSADLKTAVDLTRSFRDHFPEDPVRYDFVLTRFGIREDFDINHLNEVRCKNNV